MPLNSLSPLDGRYGSKLQELLPIFSEWGLFKYRLQVEVEYLISLSQEKKFSQLKPFSASLVKNLRQLYQDFTEAEAKQVKKIEATTNHDVKAVEYYLKNKLEKINQPDICEFVHFALTSEDINNIAYSLMLQQGVKVWENSLRQVMAKLKNLAQTHKKTALLSLTHGQPASPTTLGKEIAVFYQRLKKELTEIKKIELTAKFSGATGNWNAHVVAYPQIDWPSFSKKFVENLGLVFNPLTTQIEPHDSAARMYQGLMRVNNIIRDLDQDIWLYISRGIFSQRRIAGEVGSSTMPHKVNPIDFENSEGNAGLANSLLDFLANKLPVSRWQRDLTDSTILRNQGVAIGHSLLALLSTHKGLGKLTVNKQRLQEELDGHWEILAEPIQTILRKNGLDKPYEKLKEFTRGKSISQESLREFISQLDISQPEKKKLLALHPADYIGLSVQLVDRYLK